LKTRFIACTAASLVPFVTAPVIAADDVVSRLTMCQAIAIEADRLHCYDALASSMAPTGAPAEVAAAATPAEVPAAARTEAPAEAPTEVPAEVPPVQAAATPSDKPPPLTDDVSKVSVKGTPIEQPKYSTVVTDCKRSNQEQRTYFYMENGQVWKQSDAGRLRFKNKECQFEATIEKKSFGWRLRIPSEDRVIRVFRVR